MVDWANLIGLRLGLVLFVLYTVVTLNQVSNKRLTPLPQPRLALARVDAVRKSSYFRIFLRTFSLSSPQNVVTAVAYDTGMYPVYCRCTQFPVPLQYQCMEIHPSTSREPKIPRDLCGPTHGPRAGPRVAESSQAEPGRV